MNEHIKPDNLLLRSQMYEHAEDAGSNTSDNPTMGEMIAQRMSRRDLAKGILAVSAMAATLTPLAVEMAAHAQSAANTTPNFNFKEIAAGSDEKHYVAEGYDADVLIRWGDPVLPNAPAFDPQAQTAAKQGMQFGYNNDFLGFVSIDGKQDHGFSWSTMNTPTKN
jgi:uncharacterized protein